MINNKIIIRNSISIKIFGLIYKNHYLNQKLDKEWINVKKASLFQDWLIIYLKWNKISIKLQKEEAKYLCIDIKQRNQ